MTAFFSRSRGDSFLVIFRNVTKGVQSAVEMQRTLAVYNADKLAEEKVLLCVGLGFGKILRIGDADVFGAEVLTRRASSARISRRQGKFS